MGCCINIYIYTYQEISTCLFINNKFGLYSEQTEKRIGLKKTVFFLNLFL